MKDEISRLRGRVILVVDDEREIRRLLRDVFLVEGATVLEAHNGKLALEIVKARQIDVVFSDIRMPDGDGIELLEEIKKYNPKIPVVFMITAFDGQAEKVALAKGAAQVFHKPFSLKAILSEVRRAIPSHP